MERTAIVAGVTAGVTAAAAAAVTYYVLQSRTAEMEAAATEKVKLRTLPARKTTATTARQSEAYPVMESGSNQHGAAPQDAAPQAIRLVLPEGVPIEIEGGNLGISGSSAADVTEAEVLAAQASWANAITTISSVYLKKGDYIKAAADAAAELYGYGHSNVLFKPTKAAEYPFRPTGTEAMSYFVGGKVVDGGYSEDAGFAINGGKGWSHVVFKNHQIELKGTAAIAMGTYYFTSAADGSDTKVEYTFGYTRCADGKVRIFLHHSSVPYSNGAAKPAPVTEAEVLEVQSKWAAAIASISAVYKNKGDFVKAAADAAGELYAYGHSNVLFKPTKAAEYQFRPTAEEAMSYFVGGANVSSGYSEDAGFAINGGKGWKKCVYHNHQVDLKGGLGLAMGNYVFTCASSGKESKVEYTFGYTRCDDGKVRIFLHHSSVPYAA